MAIADKCKICKFFFDKDSTCQVTAPLASSIAGQLTKINATWPIVKPTDWCGEFINGPYKGA